MQKQCTFDELPKILRAEITSQSDISVSRGSKAYQPIQCSTNSKGSLAQCFVKDDGIFGIYELCVKEVTTTWISSSEVKMLYDHLGDIWKDGTIEKSKQQSTRP